MLLQPSRKIQIPTSFRQQTHKSTTCGRDLQRELRGRKNCTQSRWIACTLSVMNQPNTSPHHLRDDPNRHHRRTLCSVQPFDDAQCLSRSQKRKDTIHKTSQERESRYCQKKSREVRGPATAWLLQRTKKHGRIFRLDLMKLDMYIFFNITYLVSIVSLLHRRLQTESNATHLPPPPSSRSCRPAS